jgi:hypothetical protein
MTSGDRSGNAQGRDFRGEALAGADFSGADIRGSDFTGADLRAANFSHSRGGLPVVWAAVVVAGALLIACGVGVVAAMATKGMAERLDTGGDAEQISVWFIAAIGITMMVVGLFSSFRRALIVGALATCAVLAVAVPLLVIRHEFEPQTTAIGIIWGLAIMGTFTIGAVARSIAGIISPVAFLVVALAGAVVARSVGGALFSILISFAAVLWAKRALADPKGAGWLHTVARGLVLGKSTSFRDADLTGADFTKAATGPTDFTGATIKGTNFTGATLTARGKGTPARLLEDARKDESE